MLIHLLLRVLIIVMLAYRCVSNVYYILSNVYISKSSPKWRVCTEIAVSRLHCSALAIHIQRAYMYAVLCLYACSNQRTCTRSHTVLLVVQSSCESTALCLLTAMKTSTLLCFEQHVVYAHVCRQYYAVCIACNDSLLLDCVLYCVLYGITRSVFLHTL
jgi:hypothetical protein